MKKHFIPLKARSEKLKMLEKLADARESEWQKLARGIGFDYNITNAIFKELLNFGEDRYI